MVYISWQENYINKKLLTFPTGLSTYQNINNYNEMRDNCQYMPEPGSEVKAFRRYGELVNIKTKCILSTVYSSITRNTLGLEKFSIL